LLLAFLAASPCRRIAATPTAAAWWTGCPSGNRLHHTAGTVQNVDGQALRLGAQQIRDPGRRSAAYRVSRLEQDRSRGCGGLGGLTNDVQVVQDVEAAAVRGDRE
jgi:hypothetical protein